MQGGEMMTFFERACDTANKTFKRCGYAGIDSAAKTSEGWVFCADFGAEFDGESVFDEPLLFAFEKQRTIKELDWRTDEYKRLLANAVLIDVPDKYLSERRRKKNIA